MIDDRVHFDASGDAALSWLLAHGGAAVQPLPGTCCAQERHTRAHALPLAGIEAEATTQIVLRVRRADGSVEPLRWAWAYRRDGTTVQTLHTDGAGQLYALSTGERNDPGNYRTRFTAETGTSLALCISVEALPLPESVLRAQPTAFAQYTVAAQITVPARSLTITAPDDLTLWPVRWELPSAAYTTDGLPQAAALWNATRPAVTDGGPAPAVAPASRPVTQRLRIAGTIDSRAAGVNVRLLTMSGTPIAVRVGGAAAPHASATLGTSAAGTKPFEALLALDDPVRAFGILQVVVEGLGLAQPELAVATVLCCGLQIALVDDHETNADGRTAGPLHTEADERIVVDFDQSPQSTRHDIAAQSRARRMVVYRFANHRRRFDPSAAPGAANPDVLRPQMPLWMAEFQLVGISTSALTRHLAFRYERELRGLTDPWTPRTLRLQLAWRLALQWDGPDANAPAFPAIARHLQVYRHTSVFTATQTVTLRYDHRGRLTDASARPLAAGADSSVRDSLTTSTAAPAFPVAGRRPSQVLLGGRRRPWGRVAGAPALDALIVEFQPLIVDATGREILRGGDGTLELVSATFDALALPRSPSTAPIARLPAFRVAGVNPAPHAEVTSLIDALVEERYKLQSAEPRTTLLSLQAWKTTVRRIFAYENGGDHQFEHRSAGLSPSGPHFFGREADMPLFGPPHGYGFGQLDDPPTSDAAAWSFLENIRESIRRIMVDKAQNAFDRISVHLPTPLDRRIRAVYQREIVRRYNGGREFQWNGAAWEIHPNIRRWADDRDHSKGANLSLLYPNRVLGTTVVYSVGARAATTFPWPIAFASADFGPDT